MLFGKKERELLRDLDRTENQLQIVRSTLEAASERISEMEEELQAVKAENMQLRAENQMLKAEIKINRQWNNLMTYDGTPQKIEEDEDEG